MTQLPAEYETDGKRALFDHIKCVLVGGTERLSHAEIGTVLGMSETAVRKAARRLRDRYRGALRACIADTVSDPDSIDDEIRDLFAALT